jgi:hypothetical protein
MTIPSTAGSASAAYTKPAHRLLAHLPGEDGWPIIGNTLAALKDPVGRVEAMYSKYGPVYRDHLFGVRSVAMLGAEANKLVLFDHDKNFSSSDGWSFLLDRLFPPGLVLMDFDEHRLHRKALGVAATWTMPSDDKATAMSAEVPVNKRPGTRASTGRDSQTARTEVGTPPLSSRHRCQRPAAAALRQHHTRRRA